MTEYDYSPDALERYMATQDRIARWVHHTEEHRPEFDTSSGGVSKPSFFERLRLRRRSHSYDAPRRRQRIRRRDSTSSSSSSSSSFTMIDSDLPQLPGPMPPSWPQQTTSYPTPPPPPPPPPAPAPAPPFRPTHTRNYSTPYHSSSYPAQTVYLTSPPTSPPPTQTYPYPYASNTSTAYANFSSPYGYRNPNPNPTQPGVSSTGVTAPSYLQSNAGYFPQNSTYTMPQGSYPQRPSLQAQATSAPQSTYPQYYGARPTQTQTQPQAAAVTSPPAQYPHNPLYPPTTIYPLAPYGPHGPQQQQISQKPIFYQRVFNNNGAGQGRNHHRSY